MLFVINKIYKYLKQDILMLSYKTSYVPKFLSGLAIIIGFAACGPDGPIGYKDLISKDKSQECVDTTTTNERNRISKDRFNNNMFGPIWGGEYCNLFVPYFLSGVEGCFAAETPDFRYKCSYEDRTTSAPLTTDEAKLNCLEFNSKEGTTRFNELGGLALNCIAERKL